MPETDHRMAQLSACLEAYGVAARSIAWLTHGVFADVYKAETVDGTLAVWIRAPEARAEEVIFARRWAEAVSPEVGVATPLRPRGTVPMVENRCVEVAPYIANTGYQDAGPDAWVTIGRWLGCMHRLARAVEGDAPAALDYGNHPHERLFRRYLEQSRVGCLNDEHRQLMMRVDAAVGRIRQAVRPHLHSLPVGVVHGDFHFWNILYRHDQPIAVIDLDFLQRGVLLHDLAYAGHWLGEWTKRGGAWSDISARYLAAYEEGRGLPLTAEERSCLPWLLAYSGLFFFVGKARLSWNLLDRDRQDLEQAEAVLRGLGG